MVLEGLSPRRAWTRSRHLGTGRCLVGILTVLTVVDVMVVEVGLSKAGRWAEVLGSGLTNLLCVVGVTGVYWEERGREESAPEGWS